MALGCPSLKENVMKQFDIIAAVLVVVGAAGLYQGLFWKRVQGRWMRPVTVHAR